MRRKEEEEKKRKKKKTKKKNAKRRRKGQPLDSSPIDDSSCSFSLSISVVRLTGRVSETNGGALTSVGFRRGF